MSTAALWAGWQQFQSGPLPGPLSPASPSAIGGQLDQLVYAGGTEHYYFFYPANHETLGIQPDLINEVIAHVEDDYALLEEWFGASYPALTNFYVQIYDGTGGGGLSLIPDGGGGYILLISIRDNEFPYPETLRTMILHETAHGFTWQLDLANGVAATDDTGWFYAENGPGGTRSEILCRFLHSVFLAEHLGAAGTGWIGRNAYGVAQSWINSARTDYVNTAATSDNNPSAITGCGMLFLYYLRDQLGYTIPEIIAAGQFADTMADIYETLTGDSADPFPKFRGLIDGLFPSNIRAGIAGENPENPWPIGAPVCTDALPGAVVIAQAAWGADPDINPALWSWGDITRDVRQSDGNSISITAGRADEAGETQPAQCSMLLDNRDGRYALGGQNPLYPYLRRNAPIRVSASLDYGLTWSTLFWGYADGWSPDWDTTGRDAVVALSASGILRRLLQGEPPSISPFRRYVETSTSALPVVYWPMEDGEGSTSFVAAIGNDGTGEYTMTANTDFSPPKAAASNEFSLASFPLPTLGNCELYGAVPWRPATGRVSLSAMIAFPDSGILSRQPLIFLDVSGSSDWWWIEWQDPGDLVVVCQDRYGTTKVDAGFGFGGLAGRRGMLQLDLVQDGADVDYTLSWLDIDASTLGTGTGTCTSRTLGRAQAVVVNTWVHEDDGVDPAEVDEPSSAELVFGHVAVRDTAWSLVNGLPDLIGRAGEGTGNRFVRLLTEAGLTMEQYLPTFLGATPPQVEAEIMGPQAIAPVLDLLREIERVDGGILFDGFGRGLSFMPRVSLLARPASMVIDVADGHLLDPFHPDDDDQQTVNRVTVKRTTGSTVVAEDVDGPLGSSTVGLYESSVDVNTHTDAGAVQQAAWRVHLGTVPGYRYPALMFDLAKSPGLAAAWVGRTPGTRIDVRNLLDARTQHPGGELALMLQGSTQQISQKRWTVEANCSLFDPWLVGQTPDAGGGEDGPTHLDTTASVLAQFTAPGATELRVTATEGPDWTTDPADYPLVLDVGGMPVHVESCTAPETTPGAAPVVVGYQLEDDFDDNSIDAVRWPITGGTVTESGGVLQVSALAAGTFSWLESVTGYTIADSMLSALVSPPSLEGSTVAQSTMALYNVGGQGGYTTALAVTFQVITGNNYFLQLFGRVNGQTAFSYSIAWSPTSYPWVRVGDRAGRLTLEVSADGVVWLAAIRETTPIVFREAVGTLSLELSGVRSATGSAGTAATFDNVSLTRTSRESQTFTVGGGLILDDFADGVVDERIWPNSTGAYSEPGDTSIRATPSTDGLFNGLVSAGRFNLADVALSGLITPPSAEDSTFARTYLSLQAGLITTNSIQAFVDSANDSFGWYSYLGGVLQWQQFGALGGGSIWLQIYTSGDRIQLRETADGGTWTVLAEQTLHPAWLSLSTVAVGLLAARSPGSAAPGTAGVISQFRFSRAGTDSMLTAKAAGSAVKLWRPPVLAL